MGGQAYHRLAATIAVAGAALVALSACTTKPPERVVFQSVSVPIYQPCKPKLGPKPVYPTLAGPVATDVFVQMQTVLAERDLRAAWEMELEAALAGCAAHPPDG